MSKYNRWRRKVRRKKIESVIHRLSRKTDSQEIRNQAIDILNDYQDYRARQLTDARPVEETFFKIQYQLLHLVSQEEVRHTQGDKKFQTQKMAYYEEKIWDLYSELKDLKERLEYLSTHSSKGKDRRSLKKSIRQLQKRIKKLKKAYRKVRRSGLFGLFRKKDRSDDYILETYSKGDEEE
jgi:hypothetical protein